MHAAYGHGLDTSNLHVFDPDTGLAIGHPASAG
jgi:hypothetical protein